MFLLFLSVFLFFLFPSIGSETAVQYKNQAAYEEFLEYVERDNTSPEERARKQRLLQFPSSVVCRNSSSTHGTELFTPSHVVCYGQNNSFPVCKLDYNHHEKTIISTCVLIDNDLHSSTKKFCNLLWNTENKTASCLCKSDKCNTHAKDYIRDSLAAISNRHRRHHKEHHKSIFYRETFDHHHRRRSSSSFSVEPILSALPLCLLLAYILNYW
ncbi:hypothetical protein CAEBREN_07322 [Caenorhabditis brenneri]|uniref:Uncharacterized protein n=1 Tax=Caenorhabditis brenneri TaxID=135651 RepID=G0M7G7_CAEBE|nr:hypothetical protein CAEBREN_07322 [Caenorhabditis brenneri]